MQTDHAFPQDAGGRFAEGKVKRIQRKPSNAAAQNGQPKAAVIIHVPVINSQPVNPTPAKPASKPAPVLAPTQPVQLEKQLNDSPEKKLWKYFVRLRDTLTFVRPTHRQYGELMQAYNKTKNELFLRYESDVNRIVRSYVYKKMPHYSLVEADDLRQSAMMAMWRALDQYDPTVGTTFMEFFNAKNHSRLRGAIIDALRSLQEFPRDIALLRREMKPKFQQLRTELRRSVTPEEFCDRYGWEYAKKFRDNLLWCGVFNQPQKVSLSSGNGELECEEIQPLTNHQARQDYAVRRGERADFEQYILSLLEDRNVNYVMWAYFFQHETIEQITKELRSAGVKCSPSWVNNKREEGLAIIRSKVDRDTMRFLAERERK